MIAFLVSAFNSQAAETKDLCDRLIAFFTRHDCKSLRVLIRNAEDSNTVAIKRGGLANLRSDRHAVNVRDFGMEDKVVTGLLRSLTRESGVITHILQRTGDSIITEAYARLKIAGFLTKEVFIAGVSFYIET